MATHNIPGVDELFRRNAKRLSDSLAEAVRDIEEMTRALGETADANKIVERVEAGRLLRNLPGDADVT